MLLTKRKKKKKKGIRFLPSLETIIDGKNYDCYAMSGTKKNYPGGQQYYLLMMNMHLLVYMLISASWGLSNMHKASNNT